MGNCAGKQARDERHTVEDEVDNDSSSSSSSTTYFSASESLDVFAWDVANTDDDCHSDTGVDPIVREQVIAEALGHAAEARILQARAALLLAGDAEAWRRDGDVAVCRMLDDADFVERAMLDVDVEDGFTLSRDQPIRILYKHGIPGTTEHSIKLRCMIKHHPARVVSVPYEWDLLPTWNRFCVDAVKYAVSDRNPHEALVYGASWMPPPFRDFHALMATTGFDLSEEHGALLIAVRNAHRPDETLGTRVAVGGTGDASEALGCMISLPKAAKKRKWVDFLDCSYVVLTPVFSADGAVHTNATVSVRLDPHIPGIPAAIVNWVLHVFAPYLFHAVERTLDTLFHEGSTYRQRMDEAPAVYGTIDRAVEGLRRKAQGCPIHLSP